MKSITQNSTRLVAALVVSLSLAAPLCAQTMPGTNPVKIFIVAGESNTSGKGTIAPATTPGTLDHVYANDETGRYQFLKSGGSYVVRNDVWIRNYVTVVGNTPPTPTVGDLVTGLGSNSGLIGPEFGFGHIIGDVYENQILIVKVGVDAATLANSFCPPSSRVGEPEPTISSQKGFYYKEIIRLVNEAKDNLGTYFPGYTGGGYEIAGLAWHQGWNDRANSSMAPFYEVNMANFINDIRSADKGLGVANMPVVIASAAMDWNYHYSDVEIAQLRMTDTTAYPAFAGNVAVVDTRVPYDGLQFWYGTGDSPASEGYHWNRSGKSFLHVGMAMGDAMSQLVANRIPYRMRANGGSGGVTLTWNNGTETPTSVRVLRNGVEISAAAPANPPSFVDATAPLGVNNYELQLTMPVSPCPPLAISHNSGITNLKGNQRVNGLRLTWDNNLGYTGITVKRNGSIIAASLPGTTTGYTDVSPPAGVVTYSVEPDDAGGTPVEVQVTVSAALAGGAIIYEPFDMTAGTTLTGNEGGIGLDGKWDGDLGIQVTSTGLYTFGALPVSGNRIARISGGGSSCAIPIGNTLHEAGLMEHGTQLWFSFLCQNQNPTNGNIIPTLVLGDDILTANNTVAQGGNAIGARLSGSNVVGIIHKDGIQAVATGNQATLAAGEVVLVVGRITWGADDSAADTLEIYTPGTNLVLDTPLSVSAVVDQSKFKVLSMWGNGSTPNMDEIRFGSSYQAVIGMDTALSAHWDLNGTTSGAGGTDGDKPGGIWNIDANWNADITGTGPVAPWVNGNKAVFSAGTNATGAFTVTVDGTHDIGGLVFKEGAPTLSGGTALRMTTDTTIDVKTGITATIQTPVTEDAARSLSKDGPGTLVLTGTNNYTGSTYLFSGILQANSPATLPGYTTSNKIIFDGGTLGLPVGSGWSTAQVNSLLSSASKLDGSVGIDTTAGNLAQWTAFTNVTSSFGASLGLTKLGTNTLTLDQANTFAGPTRVRQGTLAITNNLALQNSALATASSGSITLSGMSSPTFGGLLDNVDLATALGAGYPGVSTLTLNPGSARYVVYDGAIADGAPGMQLVKTGVGTQMLRGANTFTGLTTLRAGTLALGSDFGTLTASSGIHLEGGTLLIESADTDIQATIDRIGNSTPFTSQGGTLSYTTFVPLSSRLFAETIGATSLLGGQTNFAFTFNKGFGSQTLTISSLNRSGFTNPSATFSALGSAPDATRNRIKINGAAATPAGGILGPWATTGSTPTAQTDYARIDASGFVVPSGIPGSSEDTWTSATGNYSITSTTGTTLTGTRTSNSLRYFAGNPVAASFALGNFNLETRGFLCSSSGGAATFTLSSTGGVIRQPGTDPAQLYLTASGRQLTITAPIQDNTGALSLVKSGHSLVLLSGAAGSIAYSGDTVVNAGDLQVNSANANNDASAVFIAPGARMLLNYTGTDTVQRLYINGSRVPNGVYSRNSSNSTTLGITSYFGTAANGSLTVTDTVAPTLAPASIVDDRSGGPVTINTLVIYTVTFSEEMTAATITASDFGNAGNATVSIGTVTQLSPSVFQVPVTPTSTGTLQLRVNADTDIRDFVNNPLNTTSAIADDTTLTVAVASTYNTWADAKGLTGLAGSSTDPAMDADPDNDGRNNLVEFAFNGDPLSSSDNGKVFVLAEDSNFVGDPSSAKELILTVAVRSGTPAFTGSPLSATHGSDGITYNIEGSLDLADFSAAVNVVPTPLASGLPAAGTGYEYRSFSLNGSNDLTGKGFLRAKVTSP